jgi:hypothetical protein
MGFLKQMKDMKNVVNQAPAMIEQAQVMQANAQQLQAAQMAAAQPGSGAFGAPPVTPAELEPINGISLERYAQLAKTVGEQRLDQAGTDAMVTANGHTPADWQAAYDGWNARMKANIGLATQFGTIYQSAVSLS